jgi:hypothetical protein
MLSPLDARGSKGDRFTSGRQPIGCEAQHGLVLARARNRKAALTPTGTHRTRNVGTSHASATRTCPRRRRLPTRAASRPASHISSVLTAESFSTAVLTDLAARPRNGAERPRSQRKLRTYRQDRWLDGGGS